MGLAHLQRLLLLLLLSQLSAVARMLVSLIAHPHQLLVSLPSPCFATQHTASWPHAQHGGQHNHPHQVPAGVLHHLAPDHRNTHQQQHYCGLPPAQV
jgi:hypothetical protein